MKFCTGVLGITLIVTNTNSFLTSCPALQGDILGYFWVYFGILRLLFGSRSKYSVKFCTDVLGVSFEGHCTTVSISWPYWGTLGGTFGLILGNVYLILHNCSIFSHETLYRCSWYNYDGHYTKSYFLYHGPRSSFLHIVLYF